MSQSDKPDKIWVESCDDEWDSGVWGQSWENDTDVKYLLATPERELASDLVETLREIASAYDEMIWGVRHDILHDKSIAVLAKLDKGEYIKVDLAEPREFWVSNNDGFAHDSLESVLRDPLTEKHGYTHVREVKGE